MISAILADEMLRPVYQPIFSLTTGELVGYEGLIRPTEAPRSPTRAHCSPPPNGRIGPSSSISPA